MTVLRATATPPQAADHATALPARAAIIMIITQTAEILAAQHVTHQEFREQDRLLNHTTNVTPVTLKYSMGPGGTTPTCLATIITVQLVMITRIRFA